MLEDDFDSLSEDKSIDEIKPSKRGLTLEDIEVNKV